MSSTPTEMPAPQVRWDLSALFSSITDPKIAETWARAENAADAFAAKYRGKIASPDCTAELLAEGISELEALIQDAAKPGSYANLLFAVEANNPEITGFLQDQSEKGSGIRVKLFFFDLEIQAIGQDRMDAMLANPVLQKYKHYINQVRVSTAYTLSEKEEVILEETANTGVRAWVRLFEEVLAQHEFNFANPETGSVDKLSESEILNLLRSPDRAVREAAGNGFSEGLGELSHVLTYIFNNILLDKKIDDKLRDRPYAEHSRHMENELQKPTVDLVMRLCKEKQDLVARYYRVKREIMGLPELTHIDRYAPLFETKEQISYDDARTLIIEAFGQFSGEMSQRADEFFDKNWIDAEPRNGKTGGAFCSYNTPDTHPVIMMSYLNKMDNVMTLAHELGHGVHASLSRAQSYFNFHGTLPLAELASIFGEQVVFDRLVKEASEEDKLALYAEKIEGTFASVFRQAAMFRFEQRCHNLRREEGELNAEEIGAVWQDELQGMFGDSVKMGDQHSAWWSYVGHFIFAPFYVYAYSFGELLSMSLYSRAQKEGPEFEAKYIKMLEMGGSKTPEELMAFVGVNLDDEAFWLGGFEAIESMISTFEGLWAATK
jgi:oligoendopeptidase F